ncbi:histidine kinase [Serratia marcescens]|uniref:response regulator n=1 Tax=Serratia marcescens TaxID=615 RepID=UPI0009A55040|nr:response regulator [Serratia marcescens]OPJ90684.1 histidine kinase [Serratia marcescens]
MMMKRLLLLSLLVSTLAAAADHITVGLLDERGPYSSFNSLQHASGALPELLGHLSLPGEIAITPKPANNLTELVDMLRENTIDMALPPPLSVPPPGILVSHSILHQHWALVSRSKHLPVRSSHILNLNQQRILLLHNSSVGKRLKEFWPDVQLTETQGLDEAIKLLNAGAADGLVCDATLADMIANNLYPQSLDSEILPNISGEQVFWLRPGQEVLLRKINERIDALSPGVAPTIITRWLLNNALNNEIPSQNTDSKFFDYAVVISCIISLFLVAFLLSEVLRRRQAERRLLDVLSYWQTLLNSVPTPLMACDPLGKITHCNQALLSSLQLTETQVTGITLNEFMVHNPISPPLQHQEWGRVINTHTPWFTDRTICIRGDNREVSLWLAAYCDSLHVPQGLLVGWYDISERKRLERELAITSQEAVNANREKSNFLARMSHEIRSPMNAILGILELEQQKQNSPDSSLNIAYAASKKLLQIVGGVLDISKIEAGELKLQLHNDPLHPLLTQIVETYTVLAEQKGLQLESNIESVRERYYRMDSTKLSQVLSNLLSNAIKYSEQGFVKISTIYEHYDSEYDDVTFLVEDSGLGVPAYMQEKILQPYVQLNPHTADSSGLGLAISTQLLKLMGSKLNIQSEQNNGSLFSFSIRLQRGEEKAPLLVPPSAENDENSLNILVVDDQPANLVVLKLQLETLGHQVTTCDDGKHAESMLIQQTFDLVLTDCQMPGMNGYQLAERQRERESDQEGYQVIIGCTANAFNNEQLRCLGSGMDGVLIKPLTLQDLRQMLEDQKKIRIDMSEIYAMAAKQPEIINSLIKELIRSSKLTLIQIMDLSPEQPESYRTLLHRQKGSFALAGFQSGIDICQRMEDVLLEKDLSLLPLYRLQLNAMILRFIAQLSSACKRH